MLSIGVKIMFEVSAWKVSSHQGLSYTTLASEQKLNENMTVSKTLNPGTSHNLTTIEA